MISQELTILIVVELCVFWYLSLNQKITNIQIYSVLNMVAIMFFAPLLISVFGLTTNIGAIYYSFVMFAQMYLLLYYGEETATKTINLMLNCMVVVLAIAFVTSMFPVLSGNEAYGNAIVLLTTHTSQVVFVSFFAFIIGQLTLVKTYSHLHNKLKQSSHMMIAFTSMVVAQIVDSLIFFPIAFYDQNIWTIMYDGILIKGVLALVLTPLLFITNLTKK